MVLFASYSGVIGGAERLLIEYATALEEDCALACPDGPLAEAVQRHGLRVFPLRGRRINLRTAPRDRLLAAVRVAGHGRELRTLVRDLDPQLVVAWGMRSAIASLLGPTLPCPVVFHHNDMLPGELIGRLVRRASSRADRVIVPSLAAARDLDRTGSLESRLVVVPPGVEVDDFAADARPAQPPEVLVLGALSRIKQPGLALEACALARRRHPQLRLRILGSPLEEEGEELLLTLRERALAPDLAGAVELIEHVADPRPELARATCLLHCCAREAFGLAVLEALAAARPAVAPDAGGPAEIVDESCGFRYSPGSASAAADALVALLSSPELAARMGANGRARARERFDRTSSRKRWCDAARAVARAPTGRNVEPSSVAVVTVTHNSESELRRLLDSVQRHLSGARVVVVDCASEDQTVALARACDCALTLALSENVGFGAGCNLGLSAVRQPVTLLLNPDVELVDDSLLELAAEISSGHDERLLAPSVLSPDGSRQDTVHPTPASLPDVIRSVVPPTALPGRLGWWMAPWRAAHPRRVGWAVGCALVARTETLRRLGPFDEQIFLYGEDLDLALRAAAGGVATWFWPAGRVIHHRAHATRPAFGGEPFELLARARRRVVDRRLGPARGAADDLAQATAFAVRILAKQLIGRAAERERRQLRALIEVRRSDRGR